MALMRFNFFEKKAVKGSDSESPITGELKGAELTSSASGRGAVVVSDSEGFVHSFDKQLSATQFRAYGVAAFHLFQLRQHSLLISIGEDEESPLPLLKVWLLDKIDSSGTPHCSRIIRLSAPGKENKKVKVTAFAVHDSLNFMAVGFEDGGVLLFRGHVAKDRSSKTQTLQEGGGGSGAITGLAFRSQSKNTLLFVTTEKQVSYFTIADKDKYTKVVVEEQLGCRLRCCAAGDQQQEAAQIAIARDDAVYFYQPEGRGACIPIEGEKTGIYWFRGYLIVITKESKLVAKAVKDKEMHIVTVYDVQNKFVAYSGPLPCIMDVLYEWGTFYVLSKDGRLHVLAEMDTRTKLDILFKKNQYQTAISLARSHQYDQDGLVEIFRQYADYLYKKGEYDSSIEQYVKTIGKLEPSYVIRQFLDAQRIHNLTLYLEKLHDKHVATEDHTTLLINCYTKVKDEAKLEAFLKGGEKEPKFDAETAVRVLRQAGYHQQALFLAEKHQCHQWYLKIQLESIGDHRKALEYMSHLSPEHAEQAIKRYGKTLIEKVPDEATQLLKKLCTAGYEKGGYAYRSRPEDFLHIFVGNLKKLNEFLQHVVKETNDLPGVIYNTLLELNLRELAAETRIELRSDKERQILALLQDHNAKYDLHQALVLCQLHNFKAGILFLYEKAKLFQQILRHHMMSGKSGYLHVVETCKKYGGLDSHLWVMALSYFAKEESSEEQLKQLKEVLLQVEDKNLLPPLLVIQTLAAQSSMCTLGVVKEYITRRLSSEGQKIAEDELTIRALMDKTNNMRRKIEELKTTATVFQVSKCSICSHPLELPSVHFLCQHSYHQHCLESYSESENECPACLPENRKVMESIQAHERLEDLSHEFHSQLSTTQDGFGVVAEFLGKGLFNKVALVTDPPSRPPPASAEVRNVAKATAAAERRNPFNEMKREDSQSPYERPQPLTSAVSRTAAQPAAAAASLAPSTAAPKPPAQPATLLASAAPQQQQQQQLRASAAIPYASDAGRSKQAAVAGSLGTAAVAPAPPGGSSSASRGSAPPSRVASRTSLARPQPEAAGKNPFED